MVKGSPIYALIKSDGEMEMLTMTNADRLDRIERTLGLILSALKLDLRQGDAIMATMDDVLTALDAETDADAAIGKQIDLLVQMVRDARGDPAKIDAALAKITANRQAIIDATTRGTQIDNPPPPPPAP